MARKDEILRMRDVLVVRRDALRRALAGDLSLLSDLQQQQGSGDVIDAALDSAQGEINSQLAEVESRELGSIEKALEQMRDGTYGLCEHCNKKIPLARLKALPYATTCIECQRLAEEGRLEGAGDADWSRVLDSGSDKDVTIGDIEMDVS
ncbi:MAG: TraR/DksA family transcriptional regulator [Pirellulales bacterium]|nr:TraR/DksA family transcriptional regulator [Pirellulales bacterium]